MKDFKKKILHFAKEKSTFGRETNKKELFTGYISEEMHRKFRNMNKRRNHWD